MKPMTEPLAAGGILIATGIGVAATMHESSMAFLIVLAGVVLCLFAFVGDRLKSVGVGGIEFRDLRKRAAAVMEASAPKSVPAVLNTRNGQELAEVMVRMMETSETDADSGAKTQG